MIWIPVSERLLDTDFLQLWMITAMIAVTITPPKKEPIMVPVWDGGGDNQM